MGRYIRRQALLVIMTAAILVLAAIAGNALGLSESSVYAASVNKTHVKELVLIIEKDLLTRDRIISGEDEQIQFKFDKYTEQELIQAVCVAEESDHLYSYGRRLLYGTWHDPRKKCEMAQVVLDNYQYYNNQGKLITCNPKERTLKMEQAIEDAKSWMTPSMSTARKLQVIHDYICRNGKYNSYREYAFNAYDILVSGQGYCAAYTDAFKLLCDEIGVECICINSDELNHTWNMVKVGQKWYNVDCTYDDTNNFDTSYYSKISHKYFLKSAKYMRKNNHYSSDWKAGIGTRYADGKTYYSWNMVDSGSKRVMVSSAKTSKSTYKTYNYPNYGGAGGATIKVNPCIATRGMDVTYGGTAIVDGGRLLDTQTVNVRNQVYFRNTTSNLKVKFKKASVPAKAKSYIKVSAGGTLTLRSGLPCGKYKIKIKATSVENKNYRSQKKNFTVTIRIR